MQTFFTDMESLIVDMISLVMGFNTSEFIDELTLALLSIFAPRKPIVVKHDYASYIDDKIHGQFMRLENERVFKYTTFIINQIISHSLS